MKPSMLKIIFASAVCALSLLAFACQTAERAAAENNNAADQTNTQQERPRTAPANAEPVTIAAVGDIMMGSPVPNADRFPPEEGATLFTASQPLLSAADIAFGNLEGPLADDGVSGKCGKGRPNCFAFRTPTRYGKHLKTAGFDILSVANNHASDFGDAGRATTRKTLDDLGIIHAGSDSGQLSTAIVESRGKKIAFIGFATNSISLNVNNLEAARAAVQAANKKADIVVVSFHAGAEGAANTRVPQRTEIFFGEARGNLPLFSRTVIDAGADLILGHGPHILRGMEIYKDRLIVYSMGNFATYGQFQLAGATAETAVFEIKIAADGKFVNGKIHPFVLEGRGIPVVDKSKSAISTVRNLSNLDFGANAPKIKDDGSF